jgi:hypothetical protein
VVANLKLDDMPGLALEDSNVLVAIRLENTGQTAATDVILNDITLFGSGPIVKVAWSPGRGGGFAQPYVRMVDFLDAGATLLKLSESQIWNSNYAFQHPYLSTNNQGEVGISVGFGGPSNYPTPLVGFVGDSTLYYANTSTTSIERWGDYSAMRKHSPNASLFSVSNYFLQSQSQSEVTGGRVVHQYILFGRGLNLN